MTGDPAFVEAHRIERRRREPVADARVFARQPVLNANLQIGADWNYWTKRRGRCPGRRAAHGAT